MGRPGQFATAVGVITSVAAGAGVIANASPAEASVIGNDDRVWVEGTTSGYSTGIGPLFVNSNQFCTAWFVEPTVVATAGHCVWEGGYLGAASDFAILPGYNVDNSGGAYKHSTCNVTSRLAHPTFRDPGSSDLQRRAHDVAVLRVSCDRGGQHVWTMENPTGNNEVAVQGYPLGTPLPPNWRRGRPFKAVSHISNVATNHINHIVDTTSGQSGLPVFRPWNAPANAGRVQGHHNYGDDGNTPGASNQATRMTATMQSWLVNVY